MTSNHENISKDQILGVTSVEERENRKSNTFFAKHALTIIVNLTN